jgi:ribosomal protein L11 methyltransferase
LKLLAPVLVDRLAPGGRLVLSGILAEQAKEILHVYEPWLGMRVADYDEGWVSLVGTKEPAT